MFILPSRPALTAEPVCLIHIGNAAVQVIAGFQ